MEFLRKGILTHPEDLTVSWLDRMAEAGLNTLGLHPVGGKNAHESLQRAIDAHDTAESRSLRKAAADRGIHVEYEAHAMRWLLPREQFEAHADWFRMDEKGERTADFNMCASNPDALDYVTERTKLLAELLDTGAEKYYYWIDDVMGCTCRCPECRKLSPGDQQMRILNAMLRGLKARRADAKLCYLAYHETMEIPRNVEPEDGIFLEFAPILRDHHRPLSDPGCEKNVRETAHLKEAIGFFGTKHSRALDYWMDNSLFSNWTKPPKPFRLDGEVMKRDLEYYDSLGFEEVTSFGCYLGPDYDGLYGEVSLKEYGNILNR